MKLRSDITHLSRGELTAVVISHWCKVFSYGSWKTTGRILGMIELVMCKCMLKTICDKLVLQICAQVHVHCYNTPA